MSRTPAAPVRAPVTPLQLSKAEIALVRALVI